MAPSVQQEMEQLLGGKVAEWQSRFSESVRPRLAQLMIDTAAVQIRKAQGQDVTLAEQALLTSGTQIPLEERERLRQASAELALQALVAVLARAAGG